MRTDGTTDGQAATRQTYEDTEVARAFLNTALSHHKLAIRPDLPAFAESLSGKRLIDIGCGPGVHAQQFASLGLEVTAIDYSEAMIQVAKENSAPGNPTFLQLDMREIGNAFGAHSFDGAWIAASLIHVPEPDVSQFLSDLHRILAPNGRARISLKAGPQGPLMVYDDKYGKGIERQFIFWQEDNFAALLREAGFTIRQVETIQAGVTGNATTTWIIFHAHTNV
jgi:ubiquinone/menaquinone biosynthesis C-methylase UbiE